MSGLCMLYLAVVADSMKSLFVLEDNVMYLSVIGVEMKVNSEGLTC